MAPKFDWNQFPTEQPTAGTKSGGGSGKFDWNQFQNETPKTTAGEAALDHFGNSVSLGYLPQIQALAGRMAPNPSADSDAQLREKGFDVQNAPDPTYVQMRDANIKKIEKEAIEHPYASAAGSVGGAVATAIPAAALTPINAATRIGRVIQAARGGAALGAISNPGDTEGKIADNLQINDRIRNAAVGAGVSAGGQGAIEGLSGVAKAVTGLPQALKAKAEERAFKSSGAMLKDYRLANKQDTINEVGRFMLDNGLVKPGMTVQDITEAAKKLKTQNGETISDIFKKLDESGASAPSHEQLADVIDKLALPSKDLHTAQPTYKALKDVAGDIRTLGKPKAPAAGTLEQLSGKGEEFLLNGDGEAIAKFQDGKMVGDAPTSGSVSSGGTVPSNPNLSAGTFQGAQDVKNFVKDQLEAAGGWKALNPTEKNLALRKAYSAVSSKLEEGAGQAAAQGGDPGVLKKYLAAKSGYGNAKQIEKIAEDQALRQNANRFLSPTDYLSGATGAVIGAASGDNLEDKLKNAAIGATAGFVHKAARTYGTPLVSVGLDKVGKVLAKTPLAATGELLSPALNAAERSPGAVATSVGVLSQPNLERAALPRVAGGEAKGEDRWAQTGLNKLGIKDGAVAQQLLQSREGKQLLIQASDLSPNSQAMQRIKDQIQKGWGQDGNRKSSAGTTPEVLRLKRAPARGR